MMNENFNLDTLPITEEMAEKFDKIIDLLGEDTSREGLLKTPMRASKAMKFLTEGYEMDPQQILQGAMFKEDYNEMVIVKDIELYSLCEHHMLPFFGKAHIAYIPNGHIVGLSKIPRVVDVFSRRLQVQERLTLQVIEELQRILKTENVACIIDAKHLCVNSRGISDVASSTVTAEYGGVFKTNETLRKEFLSYIQLETEF